MRVLRQLQDYLHVVTKIAKHHNLAIAIDKDSVYAMNIIGEDTFKTVLKRSNLKDMAKSLPILLDTDCKLTLEELELISTTAYKTAYHNLEKHIQHIIRNGTHPFYSSIYKAINILKEKTDIKLHIGFDFSSEQPTVKITPEVPEYFALREGRIKMKANEIRGEFLDEFIKEHDILKEKSAPPLYNTIADIFLDAIWYDSFDSLEELICDIKYAAKAQIEQELYDELNSYRYHVYRLEKLDVTFDIYGNLYVGGIINEY